VLRRQFAEWEGEVVRLVDGDPALVLPAYEGVLKCSHLFNVLDARGALSVTERAASIQRIRRLACRCAEAYLAGRERAGFPLSARQTVGHGDEDERGT
jgi:glycyl-tRNA synthetase alpha chain